MGKNRLLVWFFQIKGWIIFKMCIITAAIWSEWVCALVCVQARRLWICSTKINSVGCQDLSGKTDDNHWNPVCLRLIFVHKCEWCPHSLSLKKKQHINRFINQCTGTGGFFSPRFFFFLKNVAAKKWEEEENWDFNKKSHLSYDLLSPKVILPEKQPVELRDL